MEIVVDRSIGLETPSLGTLGLKPAAVLAAGRATTMYTVLLTGLLLVALAESHSLPAASVHRANQGSHHTSSLTVGCGHNGIPCPESQRTSATHAVDYRHQALSSRTGMQHHPISAERVAAAHHADVTIAPHRVVARSSGERHRSHHPAASASMQDANQPDGSKGPGCQDFAAAFGGDTIHEDNLDIPVGIDPATGREVESEDIAEAEIAAEAKKAGMNALEYEINSGVETHYATEHHTAPLDGYQSDHGSFKLVYTLAIYIKADALEAAKHTLGDVYYLTRLSQHNNHTLMESFHNAVLRAITPAFPDGVADLKLTNVVFGHPVDVDIAVYPDTLTPDEFNPAQTLASVDRLMHQFDASHIAAWFVEQYGVAEVQVTASSDNRQVLTECAQAYPFEDSVEYKPRGLGHTLAMAVFVWCPLLLAMVATARHGLVLYQKHNRGSVLPKGGLLLENDGLKSACASSGGAAPNVANIYASPVGYYAGPYRTSYSSSGGASSDDAGASCRVSSNGGMQPSMSPPFQAVASDSRARDSRDN